MGLDWKYSEDGKRIVLVNGDKKELYLDAYKKFENKCIEVKGEC